MPAMAWAAASSPSKTITPGMLRSVLDARSAAVLVVVLIHCSRAKYGSAKWGRRTAAHTLPADVSCPVGPNYIPGGQENKLPPRGGDVAWGQGFAHPGAPGAGVTRAIDGR